MSHTEEWIIFVLYAFVSLTVHVACFVFVCDFWSLRKEKAIVSRTPELVVINFIGVVIQLFNGMLRMLHRLVHLGDFFKVSQSTTMAAIWRVDWHYTLTRYEAEKVWKSELGMTLDKATVLSLTPVFRSWQTTFLSCLVFTLLVSTPVITSVIFSPITKQEISIYMQIMVLGLCVVCACLSIRFVQTTSTLGQTYGLRKEMRYMIVGFGLAVISQLLIILLFRSRIGFWNMLTLNCRDTTLIFAYFYVAAHMSTAQCPRRGDLSIEALADPSLHFNTVSLTASSMRGNSRSVSLHSSMVPSEFKDEGTTATRKFSAAGTSSMLLQSVLRDYDSFVLLTEHCVSEMSVEGILFIVWYMRAKQLFFVFLRERGLFEYDTKDEESADLERRIRFLQLVLYPQAYESYIDEHYRDHHSILIDIPDFHHSGAEAEAAELRSKSSEQELSARSRTRSDSMSNGEPGVEHPPKGPKPKYPKSRSLRLSSPRSGDNRKLGSKTLSIPKLSLRRQSSDSRVKSMGFKDLRITVDRGSIDDDESKLGNAGVPTLVGMLTDPLSCTPTPVSTVTPSVGDRSARHGRALSLEDQIIGLNDADSQQLRSVMRVVTLSQDSPASMITSQPSLARPSATATLESASSMMSNGLVILQDTPTGAGQRTISAATEVIAEDCEMDRELDESSKEVPDPDTPGIGAVAAPIDSADAVGGYDSIELQPQLTQVEPTPPPPSLPGPPSPPIEEASPPQASMSQLLDTLRHTSVSPRQRFSTRWRSLSAGRLTAPRKAVAASATPPPLGAGVGPSKPSLAQLLDGTISPRPQTMRIGQSSHPMTFSEASDAAHAAGVGMPLKYRKEIGTVICLPIEVFAQYQPSESDQSLDATRAMSPSVLSQQQLKEQEKFDSRIEEVATMLLSVLDKYVSLEGIQCVNVSGSCRRSALRHRDRLRAISGGMSGDGVLETISQSLTIEKKVRFICQSLLCLDGVLTDVVRVLKTDVFRRFTNTSEFQLWYDKHYPSETASA